MKIRVHVLVGGRVQGVYFRGWTQQRARKSGVSGWVRNLSDGKVEAVLEGEEEAVGEVVDFCRTGPPRALVTDIEIRQEPYVGEYKSFEVI